MFRLGKNTTLSLYGEFQPVASKVSSKEPGWELDALSR